MSNYIKQIITELKAEKIISSRKELAQLLEYSPSTVSNMINGYTKITQDTINRMKTLFGINPIFVKTGKGDYFIDGKPLNPRENTIIQSKETINAIFDIIMTGDLPVTDELEETLEEIKNKLEKFLS